MIGVSYLRTKSSLANSLRPSGIAQQLAFLYKKIPSPVYRRRDTIPCYHFNSLTSHDASLCRCLECNTLCICSYGSIYISDFHSSTSPAITGGPVRTYHCCSVLPLQSHLPSAFPNFLSASAAIPIFVHTAYGNLSVRFQPMYSLFQRVSFILRKTSHMC